MGRRMKRKYTRKATKSKSRGVKLETGIKLPPDILSAIERTLAFRKSLGLPNDREERIQRALKYQSQSTGIKNAHTD